MQKLFSLPPVSFVVETAELFLKMGASRAAAALSYFLILTLFPLLVCVNYFIGLFHLDLEELLRSLDQLLQEGRLVAAETTYGAGIRTATANVRRKRKTFLILRTFLQHFSFKMSDTDEKERK